jgi:hypothetical protein
LGGGAGRRRVPASEEDLHVDRLLLVVPRRHGERGGEGEAAGGGGDFKMWEARRGEEGGEGRRSVWERENSKFGGLQQS